MDGRAKEVKQKGGNCRDRKWIDGLTARFRHGLLSQLLDGNPAKLLIITQALHTKLAYIYIYIYYIYWNG